MKTNNRIHFLYQNTQLKNEVFNFLSPYCQIAGEALPFSLEGIKTKELYFQIEKRLAEKPFDFLILQTEKNLEMFDAMKRRIAIDFDEDKLNYHRKVIAKDPFLRAVGRARDKVLDISAGLGVDAVFLAQQGHDVTAVERNPLLFLLLDHAQKQSQRCLKLKIKFEFGEAAAYLAKADRFDCIFFDPMFPEKVKTALPKQEMVLFRQLVGNDMDSDAVLESALASGTRVVVKRPIGAPPLLRKPENAFESKLIRFDIYEGR